MDIAKLLQYGWKEFEWSCEDTYESIIFHTGIKPSEEEITAKWNEYLIKRDTDKKEESYRKSLPEGKDALYALITALGATMQLPEDVVKYRDRYEDVKNQFNKGE